MDFFTFLCSPNYGNHHMGVPEMGVPQNGWFIVENPSIDGRFRGIPILGNLHMKSRAIFHSHDILVWSGVMNIIHIINIYINHI